jgi:acyl carrier protein
MDLVVDVEDHFDISVPINALAEVRTVGDFATLIQKSTG